LSMGTNLTRWRSPVVTAGKLFAAALAIAAMANFAFYTRQLFLKYPPVWPDESLFANGAINLLRQGALATSLLSGVVPGIEHRTYLMPPGYYCYLACVFSVWGPSIFAVRLASLAASLLVMGLTYSLGLRSGLGAWLSLIPVSLLAVDSVFLRAGLIGRMDVLALGFILLALRLSLGKGHPRNSAINTLRSSTYFPAAPFLTGLACALAFLTHPIGAVAILGVGAAWTQLGTARRWSVLLRLLAGFSPPMLAWFVYIIQDPGSFIAQFGSQLMRKAGRHPGTLARLMENLVLNFGQWGLPQELMGLVWVCGLGGLFLAARRRRELLVLSATQFGILVAILWSKEIWYPVYLAPLTALGLGLLLAAEEPWGLRKTSFPAWPHRNAPAPAAERLSLQKAFLPGLALSVSILFARGDVRHLAQINALQNRIYQTGTNYLAFCKGISAVIPPGSRTLISVIPDPYLELAKRPDLALREFVPEGFSVDRDRYRRYLAASDYVVAGLPGAPSVEVSEFLQLKGELMATVGESNGIGYYARIYRVKR
jgi:hypothetical protein